MDTYSSCRSPSRLTHKLLCVSDALAHSQLLAVVPISILLIAVMAIFFGRSVTAPVELVFGISAAIIGLALFIDALRVCVMPLSETLGTELPKTLSLPATLCVSCFLGILVTYAEPAITTLRPLAKLVDPDVAPYLYCALMVTLVPPFSLNLLDLYVFPAKPLDNRGLSPYVPCRIRGLVPCESSCLVALVLIPIHEQETQETLVFSIGLGVGMAATLGTLRFVKGWSLKPLILIVLSPTLMCAIYMWWGNPELRPLLGLAWDCGAVTTGRASVLNTVLL